MFFNRRTSKLQMPDPHASGSDLKHFVLSVPLDPPYPDGTRTIRFGMGCFWGVERLMWEPAGVYVTSVGYAGGHFPNPDYETVCTGSTGHAEVVKVVFDDQRTKLKDLLKIFWENHDPTTKDRQGNDVGSQYRSIILCDDEDTAIECRASMEKYQANLTEQGFGEITTEIMVDTKYHLAEEYHQQYLAKNPGGYCNHGFCQAEYS